ncbi:MAG: hypothetical protein HC855_00855 [Rhizobiales bacterium]|nr:hypothetical protein [Hyphomicrobiales bacterium]
MRLNRSAAKYLLLAPLFIATLPQAAHARLEAKMYAITIWNGGCGGSQRDAWDDMADAWYDEITDTGISILDGASPAIAARPIPATALS